MKVISWLSLYLLAGGMSVMASEQDSVVMTVAGKPVKIDEFLFMAKKNGAVNLSDAKERASFVELYKNFKLKVAEAEAEGVDKTSSFKEELSEYRSQLISEFLSDEEAEDRVVRAEFDRMKEMVECSHILFRLPEQTVSNDTLPVYNKAMEAYERIKAGEDFQKVAQEYVAADKEHVAYEYVYRLLPMQTVKAFENVVFTMPVGSVTAPVRTKMGFHIIKLHSKPANPGKIRVAHILLPFKKDGSAEDSLQVKKDAEKMYEELIAGADFAEMAKSRSADVQSAKRGGELPAFNPGTMVREFEEAAYALNKEGELSEPVKSKFGYHIIKLISKEGLPEYDKESKRLRRLMAQGERNFELYQAFDDRMKAEYGYKLNEKSYAQLQDLCDEYFPTSKEFYDKAKDMSDVLFVIDGKEFLQKDFVNYMQRCPFSTKTYSGDFMHEVFELYVREILTSVEKSNLKKKHPEFDLLMNEYRDGILLFEISNRKIWSKPAEEQKALEEAWIKELEKKYPVEINQKVLKRISKK